MTDLHDARLVLSLTSIPSRFGALGPVLESLLAQGADAVFLAIPKTYWRFPGKVPLPPLPEGVTLIRPERDDGPSCKLLPALRLCQRACPKARIIACDDDVIYGPGWADALLAAPPGMASTGAGWRVDRLKRRGVAAPEVDIAQGFSGLCVTADMFDEAVFTVPPEAWPVDDIWLSGHLARGKTPIRAMPDARALCQPQERPDQLQNAETDGRRRGEANAACAAWLHQRYGIWPLL